ncbi:F0F1 ATP synthase subunit B [Synechococcus sp. C9]|jgi:F-type H+-transporting ATPase subunit b|uniref:F0F1 ATP synthase subunit B n=1 Tax=Synechococcus sp. C9 TaxID=102119 RepID=UPI001FF6AFE1|nr:F0F1 ATP synthase subunit B [Synechococcus sp. C9]
MDSLLLAMVEEGAGVRFNPDLLGTNALNIFLVLGLLIYYGRGFLGNLLGERQQTIAQTIQRAETAQKEAAATLKTAQHNLAQAQAMAAQLKQEGLAKAEQMRADLLALAAQEVERIGLQAQQSIELEQERTVAAIRQRITELTLAYVTAQLQQRLTPEMQSRLIDQGIARLGGGA